MTDPRCGTYAGVNAHNYAGTPVCDACKDARRRYQAGRRLYLTSHRHVTFPVDVARFPDIPALGATIAAGFRESA